VQHVQHLLVVGQDERAEAANTSAQSGCTQLVEEKAA